MRAAVVLAVSMLCALGFSDAKSGWERTTRHVAKTTTPPKIDGKLDDECWKTAVHADGFHRFQSSEPVHERTEGWITSDKTHLYIAFYCHDTQPNLIRAHETQREGDLGHDDVVGLVVDSQLSRRNCSQFTVSARGTQQTQLEGGTAGNLTWAGDWTAATQRTADGWTAEISIPFAMLRYPRGTKAFGLAIFRQIARETNIMIWPRVPEVGFSDPIRYLDEFDGIEPPYIAPRLVALPYTLGSVGNRTTGRGGIDLKYPVSTTLTGVATLFPDFATVEQVVQDLSFSYTEKFLPDQRPFFAEGSNFLNDSSLFYSQRIQGVDAGAKLIGKQGNTTISTLATTANQTGQTAFMADVNQDIGAYGKVGAAVLGNNTDGQAANRVFQINGGYGWARDGRQSGFVGNYTGSTVAGSPNDHAAYVQFSTDAGRGKWNGNVYATETGPNFVNQLGYIPEVDLRGGGFNLFYYNNFDKGAVEHVNWGASGSSFAHMTGGFFHDSMSFWSNVNLRTGLGANLSGDISNRENSTIGGPEYRDNTVSGGVGWNQKNVFDQGSLNLQIGHRTNQPYSFLSLSQGILITKPFSLQLTVGRSTLGTDTSTQSIVSGTYRINPHETIGARAVQQNSDFNIYMSYGRRVRHGTDVFVILGDPNATRFRRSITLKLVRPL